MSDAQDDEVQQLITRARNLLDDRDDDNNIHRAESLFQDAVLIAPEEGAIWQGLGDVRWLNGEYPMALEYYQRARDLGVDDAVLWGRMATIHAEFQHRADALEAIDRALELAPADQSVLENFIQIVTKLQLWRDPTMREQALRVANRAEELAPQDIVAQAYAIYLLVILRLDDASLKERTLLALASFVTAPVPSEYRTFQLGRFNTYSGMLILEGRYREALAVVEQMMTLAQEIDSASSRMLWEGGLAQRAILLAQLGAYDEALHALEHYLRAVKSPKFLWQALYPELLLETARVTEAIEQVERLLSKPQSREYAYPLQVKARILAKLGRDDESIVAEHAAATRANTTTPLDTLIPQIP
ncbi:MAG TPA: hypothetical protein VF812_11315 [Ktedonobacterales bacterium]